MVRPKTSVLVAKAGRGQKLKSQEKSGGEDGGFGEDGFSSGSGFVGRGEGKEFDRDPEFAEIMGACLDDPQKARSKMEERLRKKRNKILLTKSGVDIGTKEPLILDVLINALTQRSSEFFFFFD
ncbi:hypothetical protein RchiOBHm_Chr2g0093991 [Rosa chinensis]|uniref:Uncharacterized protein n=1 Tax=Rosa chinensis TaxID=74649 RepID=A0A2P6RKD6_ROSCH|nr:hypothetical protein RchiOBHm_Chr2g0093991 [Rosa chinensis]